MVEVFEKIKSLFTGNPQRVQDFTRKTTASEEQVRQFFEALHEEGIMERISKNVFVLKSTEDKKDIRRMNELASRYGINNEEHKTEVVVDGEN